MSRATITRAGAAGLVLLALVLLLARGGDDGYRVAAIFDTAEGVAPGYVVKVAGVRVGRVEEVHLDGDLKARIELEVDDDFAPFKADARCRILPESLISEKFVDCTPGRAERALRPAAPGGLPTVALARTQVPVAVQDVLDIFAQPAPDRLRILLNEMGASVAGRSGDLNALLRRASPVLGEVRDTLAILSRQRAQLRTAIVQTDEVVASLTDRRKDLTAFVARADDVVQTTAPRARQLGAAVRELPALTREAARTFRHLRQAADAVTPLLGPVREAAPRITALATALPAFARDGTPAVVALGEAARAGRWATSSTAPVARRLERLTARSGRPVGLVESFLVDLRDRGGIEGALRFLYTLSSLTANYDGVSHLATVQLTATACFFAPESTGCDGRFVSQARQDAAAARPTPARRTSAGARRPVPEPGTPPTPGTAPPAPATPAPSIIDATLGRLVPGRSAAPREPIGVPFLDRLLRP